MSRMNPRLFAASATSFTTRGIGTITDAITCEVTEGRNAAFDLRMKVPITSKYFAEIKSERILLVKPNPYDNPQPFRIHKITKPINGIVTVLANHLSYDLKGFPLNPFIAEGAKKAVKLLTESTVVPCPFTITTDITSSVIMTVADPHTVRDYMGGMEGSLIDHYGGEYQFDTYSVQLLKNRGADRGVKIKYGVNLIDLTQEENCASVYTGVLPYFSSEKGKVVGDVQYAPGTFEVVRILPLDLTDKYDDGDDLPTIAQLNKAGAKYITDNSVGVPKVSLSLSYEQLDRKEVHLCDTVTVFFERMGIDTKAKVIETVYDALKDRYKAVKIGEPRANIANSIADEKEARAAATKLLRTYIEKTDIAIRLEALARADEDTAIKGTLEVHADEIDARVTKTGGDNKSFGWKLTADGHIWYAGSTEVMKVTASGLEVKGKVTATSGYIGNGAVGFEIGSTYIRNGMQSLSDKNHNGVYIGTDGIALGGGKFKVDAAGNLYASSGTFTGSVRADKILYGDDGGTLHGDAITPASLGGGRIVPSSVTTTQTAAGINTSLGYANFSNGVFSNTEIADYVGARYVTATSSMYAPTYYVALGGDSEGTVNAHTHQITEKDGVVTIGKPDFAGNEHSFNIADTKYYKDGVSAAAKAVTISTIALGVDDSHIIGYNASAKTLTVPVIATASNGNSKISYVSADATKAYNAGYAAAPGDSSSSVYCTSVNYAGGPYTGIYGSKSLSVIVYLSNGNSYTKTVSYYE